MVVTVEFYGMSVLYAMWRLMACVAVFDKAYAIIPGVLNKINYGCLKGNAAPVNTSSPLLFKNLVAKWDAL